MNYIRLLIAGSRDLYEYEIVKQDAIALIGLFPVASVEIVQGECPTGIDQCAKRLAEEWGCLMKPFPPDWKQYGLAAGPIRNKEMAIYTGEAQISLALIVWDGKSKGSASMLRYAKQHVSQIKSRIIITTKNTSR